MDIEGLNKMQIVLLTLLVSFVTSIATGIVTVTLLDQAPPAITQTIHKVVEKTIETVNPQSTQVATINNKEVVIVKEQNLIADAFEKNSKTFVRINRSVEEGVSFVGFGAFVDKKGIILTGADQIVAGEKYSITLDDKVLELDVLSINTEKKVAYLKTIDSETGIFKPIFKTIDVASSDSLKLGQSVVSIGGLNSNEVLTGIVSGLVKDKIITKTDTKKLDEKGEPIFEEIESFFVSSIKTNISISNIINGALLMNLEGNVIGINVDSDDNSFISIDFVKQDLQNILNPDVVKNID